MSTLLKILADHPELVPLVLVPLLGAAANGAQGFFVARFPRIVAALKAAFPDPQAFVAAVLAPPKDKP